MFNLFDIAKVLQYFFDVCYLFGIWMLKYYVPAVHVPR